MDQAVQDKMTKTKTSGALSLASPPPTPPPITIRENRTLAARVTDFLFTDEKTQKFTLTLIAFFSMVSLTWYRKTFPAPPVGLRLNMNNILWLSAIYFYYQMLSLLLNPKAQMAKEGPLPNYQFFVEFIKFFFALTATFFYTQFFFGQGNILDGLRIYGYGSFLLMYSLVSLLAAALFYRFQLLKSLALQSRVAQAEAQYSMLESQMQPHFLFNSLNVLSELIYVDPDHANAMSQQLADLYREILSNSKSKFSTLESELSILRKYVDIQKIRFGDRIQYSERIPDTYGKLPLPSLMLQTLVENAIKHGISPKRDGGEIQITVEKTGSRYKVIISNTGALYKGHKPGGRSTGLENTQNRLDLIYGDKHRFQIYSKDNRTFVEFCITGRTS